MSESEINNLKAKIAALEEENKRLKNAQVSFKGADDTVHVPDKFKSYFDDAEQCMEDYFHNIKIRPDKAHISISGERYVLVRASSLSYEFLEKIRSLYADKGEEKADRISKNMLFDMTHIQGMSDAEKFAELAEVDSPLTMLTAGPVHFAYAGWASVEILPESNLVQDENFFLKYRHPYSFEADSWIKKGVKANAPVCTMNAGYSSGWCEKSFGIPLTAVEITCKAKGDKHCTFIMAPPHKIHEYLPKKEENIGANYEVPLFFERQKAEQRIRQALHEKDLLLKEVHHRVKNNLQVISSMLNLQSKFSNTEKDLFQSTVNRIQAMALVHEKLHSAKDVENVEIGDYLNSIIKLIKGSHDTTNLKINSFEESNAQSAMFPTAIAISLGLITNELISNAFQHAFENTEYGEINVDIQKENSDFSLTVSDDGVGVDDDFLKQEHKSLGWELIDSLVDQIEGNIQLLHSKRGASFMINFKS